MSLAQRRKNADWPAPDSSKGEFLHDPKKVVRLANPDALSPSFKVTKVSGRGNIARNIQATEKVDFSSKEGNTFAHNDEWYGKLRENKSEIDRTIGSEAQELGKDQAVLSFPFTEDEKARLELLATTRSEKPATTARRILEYMLHHDPILPEGMSKARITFKLSADARGAVSELADACGMKQTEFMALQVRTYLDRILPSSDTITFSLDDGGMAPVFTKHATPEEIGRRLRAARKEKGWTQLELAKKMGHTSHMTVVSLESGKHGQTVTSLGTALAALDLTEL